MTLTAEQLARRREGITSTDIAAICGLNPYCSPMAVYLDKIGKPLPFEGNEATYWGLALEDDIAERRQAGLGDGLRVVRNTETIRHPSRPWMLATVDGFLVDATGAQLGVEEFKTAWASAQVKRWGQGGDQVPEEYLLQCAWGCGACDLAACHLSALLSGWHGPEFREYALARDPVLEARLIEIGEQFLIENVRARVPPPPGGFAVDFAALRALYPQTNRETRQATDEEAAWMDEFIVANDWAKERDRLKQLIMAGMGETYAIESEDHRALWYPSGKSRTFKCARKGE